MTSIEFWMQTPAAIAIARTLLHSLWQASLAALALALCLRFTHAARIHYACACAALGVIVIASISTFVALAPQASRRIAPQDLASARSVAPFGVGTGVAPVPQSTLERVLPWLTPVWLLGVAAFSVWRAAGWAALQRLLRQGVSAPPEAWVRNLDRIRARMKVAAPVSLLESCATRVPLVIGHLRPAILMPVGVFAGLAPDQVELILIHELAHIGRYDYLINMVQTLVEGVMFYNPAVWWISNVIRAERENCCDDIVMETRNAGPLYASALAALEEIRFDQREVLMAASGGNLLKRIRRILRQPEPQPSVLVPVFSAVAIIIVAGVLAAHPQAQTALANAYQTWLDEDVVYIITPAERVAFLTLSTDAERNEFIGQFWQRRDPTPGTLDNEFKDQHYLRIAYANEHFASTLPGRAGVGWRTDRGRIYIMYGPPDERETHPAGTYVRPDGTTQPFASDIWLYRYLQGIGSNILIEFEDLQGTGEFRQSKDPAIKLQLQQRPR
jgi:GWxTD domain-containing protein